MIRAANMFRILCSMAGVMWLASCTMLDEPPIPLPEGRWELLSASFTDTGRIPGIPRATLEIRNGLLAAYSGCNNGTGSVASVDGRMVVEQLAATRRACLEPLGGFEGRLFRMLRDKPYFRVENGVLTLAAGDLSARFRQLPDTSPAVKPAQP